MTIFNDQAATDALYNRAQASPAFMDDMGPSILGGVWRGLSSAIPAVSARAGLVATQAAEGLRPSLSTVDAILGTSSADVLTATQARAKAIARQDIPRPWELGTAGSVVHGLATVLPEMVGASVAAAPAGPGAAAAAAVGYETYATKFATELEYEAEHPEVDAATRGQIGTVRGLSTGLGVLLPMRTAIGTGMLREATQIGAQAAIGAAFGVGSRAAEAEILKAQYPDIARQIQVFGASEVALDAAINGLFGPIALRAGHQRAPELPATPTLDAIMADHTAGHAHVDTMPPGVLPTDANIEAHIDSLVSSTEQMARGEPVQVAGDIAPVARPPVAPEVEAAVRDAVVEQQQARAEAMGAEAPAGAKINEAPLAQLAPEQADVLRRLYDDAAARKPGFDGTLEDIAKSVGGKAELPALKSAERAVEKIAVDYSGEAGRIKDLLRGSVTVDSQNVDAAINGVTQAFPGATIKRNLFAEAESTMDGYRDVLINVVVDGHVAEVQIHIPEMAEAKKVLHRLYVERESMMRAAEKDGRQLTDAEFARFAELSATMREGYEAAFSRALKRAAEMATPRAADAADIGSGLPSTQRSATPLSNETGSPSTSKNKALGPNTGTTTEADITATSAAKVAQKEAESKTLANARFGGQGEVLVGEAFVPYRWALIEADRLAPSVSKSDSQARDRTRAASDAQLAKMASALDFRLLNDAPDMGMGAPTLTKDGAIVGGNQRVRAIQRAYGEGTAIDYRQALERAADRYGFDAAEAAGMKAPALVRVLDKEVDVRTAAVASNEGAGLRMSLLEQAPVDAARLPPLAGFHVPEDGNLNAAGNRDFVMAWVRNAPGTEQAALVDADGVLSQEGMIRLRNAVLFKAYGDSPTLARLVELSDPGVKNVATALTRAGPPVAAARDAIAAGNLHSLDIVPDVIAAAEKMAQLRGEGTRVADFASQGEIFGASMTQEAKRILLYLDRNARSAKAMADMIAGFYGRLERAGNPKEGDMFGGGVPTKAGLLDAAISDVEAPENPTLGLFGATPDPFPGRAGAPRSAEQALYDAQGRVDGAERDAPLLDSAVRCESV